MRHPRWLLLVSVLVILALGSAFAPPPAAACGHVKCNDPSEPGCWMCTYSLYFFQRCHYWCKQVATGAIHSSCWEEDCYNPADLTDREAGLSLADLGLDAPVTCAQPPAPPADDLQPAPETAAPAVRATELTPRT
jgi:hypothetical protein